MYKKILIGLIGLSAVFAVAFFLLQKSSGRNQTGRISEDPGSMTAEDREKYKNINRLRSMLRMMPLRNSEQEDQGEAAFKSILSLVADDRNVVVVDAKKLLDSKSGKLIAQCLKKFHKQELKAVQREFGIDPLREAEKIAVAHHFILVSGQLNKVASGNFYAKSTHLDYGEEGIMMTPVMRSQSGPIGGLWGEDLLVVSDNSDDIREAIDITEGREQPSVSDPFDDRVGSLYGNLEINKLFNFFGPYYAPKGEIAAMLEGAVNAVYFDIETNHDVHAVLDLEIEDREKRELFTFGLKSLQAALSLKTSIGGENLLAQLLDYSLISSRGSVVHIEIRLPLEFVENSLSYCND